MKDRNELLDILASRVRTSGVGGLTTAEDVRAVLTDVIDAIFDRSGDMDSYMKRADGVLRLGDSTISGKKTIVHAIVKTLVLFAELARTPLNGQLEYDGTSFYMTTGGTRSKISSESHITELLTGYSKTSHTHPAATEAANGMMSKEDKQRLNQLVQATDLITGIKIGSTTYDVGTDTTIEFYAADDAVNIVGNVLGSTIQVAISFDKDGLEFIDQQDLDRWKTNDLDDAYAPLTHTHDFAAITNKSERFPVTGTTTNIPWTTTLRSRFGDNPIALFMVLSGSNTYRPYFDSPISYSYTSEGVLTNLEVTVGEGVSGFILIR